MPVSRSRAVLPVPPGREPLPQPVPKPKPDDRFPRRSWRLGKIARRKLKGDGTLELALVLLILVVFLAAAVDVGRVIYTNIIIADMAGEGASFAALYPERDSQDSSCSTISYQSGVGSIQERVRQVAKEHGLILSAEDLRTADIAISSLDYGRGCSVRCYSVPVQVAITYRIHDLFFPPLIGPLLGNDGSVTIHQEATSMVQRDVPVNASCP